MEEHKARLWDAFGESSDSESEPQEEPQIDFGKSTNFEESESIFGENPNWERITEIKGLRLCRNFLSLRQQSSLLSEIEKEGWFTEASHNQAMRFGDLPAWATEISSSIKELIQFSDCLSEPMDTADCDKDKEACLFPPDLLWREPLFDQLIVNVYQPGNLCTC